MSQKPLLEDSCMYVKHCDNQKNIYKSIHLTVNQKVMSICGRWKSLYMIIDQNQSQREAHEWTQPDLVVKMKETPRSVIRHHTNIALTTRQAKTSF